MKSFKVVGGLEGCYQPSYSSQLVEKQEEAIDLLVEKYREEKEIVAIREDTKILEESRKKVRNQGFFTVDRGETKVRKKVKVVEVEEPVIKTSDHQANRMF